MDIANQSLCKCCQRVFDKATILANGFKNFPYLHHKTDESFSKAIESGCQLCAQIKDHITRNQRMRKIVGYNELVKIEKISYAFKERLTSAEEKDKRVVLAFLAKVTGDAYATFEDEYGIPGLTV
jgi:hypothetical protein